MARARSRSTLVLSTDPKIIASVTKRQQAAAQLVASGAVTVVNAEAGTATVRGAKDASYHVTATAAALSCTCDDGAKGNVCKHLRAVISKLGSGPASVFSCDQSARASSCAHRRVRRARSMCSCTCTASTSTTPT